MYLVSNPRVPGFKIHIGIVFGVSGEPGGQGMTMAPTDFGNLTDLYVRFENYKRSPLTPPPSPMR